MALAACNTRPRTIDRRTLRRHRAAEALAEEGIQPYHLRTQVSDRHIGAHADADSRIASHI